ncbi:10459_t:CDS:2, partial [Funneliformis caledonium]
MDKYKVTSLQEERGKNRIPYSYWEDTLYLKDTPHSRQENILLNRNRSQTPYFQLSRNRSRTPYSRQEDTLLSRNRSQTQYSPLNRSASQTREDISLRRNRTTSPIINILADKVCALGEE